MNQMSDQKTYNKNKNQSKNYWEKCEPFMTIKHDFEIIYKYYIFICNEFESHFIHIFI